MQFYIFDLNYMQFDIIFPVKAFNIIHEGYLRFQTKFERGIQEKARWLRSSGGLMGQ